MEAQEPVCPESTIESAVQRNSPPRKVVPPVSNSNDKSTSKGGSKLACESTIDSSLRRDFIKKAALLGAAAAVGTTLLGSRLVPESSARSCVRESSSAGPDAKLFECCPTGIAIEGKSCSATGVLGVSTSSIGVAGASCFGPAVYGASICSYGVYGSSFKSVGVLGRSCCSYAVCGGSFKSIGVRGASYYSYGVAGSSSKSYGVSGESCSSYGVYGSSPNSVGVYGQSCCYVGVYGLSCNIGVCGYGCSSGVHGDSYEGSGVKGTSNLGTGVYGNSTYGPAVYAQGTYCVGLEATSCKPLIGKFKNTTSTGDRTALVQFDNADSTPVGWNAGVAGVCNACKVPDGSFYVGQPAKPRLVVNTCGNVGVGTLAPNTTLQVNGSLGAKVATPSCSTYCVGDSCFAVLVNATAAAKTVNLPKAIQGMILYIKNTGTDFDVTIKPKSGDTIEGATSKSLKKKFGVQLIAGGNSPATWYIISYIS